jgi:hypothetical protein
MGYTETKEWKALNPDKVREQKRRYNQRHPEKRREQRRRYCKKYPDKVKSHNTRKKERDSLLAKAMKSILAEQGLTVDQFLSEVT